MEIEQVIITLNGHRRKEDEEQ